MSKLYVELCGEVEDLTSAYYPKRVNVEYDAGGPSMTRQEFTEECDINTIMARYEKSGVWPPAPNGVEPVYYDFSSMPGNLQEGMELMMQAETAFMKLPAVVRKEFDNDAVRFVEYASDGANLDRMREWGLAAPEKAPDAPIRVEVVGGQAPPSSSSTGAKKPD